MKLAFLLPILSYLCLLWKELTEKTFQPGIGSQFTLYRVLGELFIPFQSFAFIRPYFDNLGTHHTTEPHYQPWECTPFSYGYYCVEWKLAVDLSFLPLSVAKFVLLVGLV